MISIRRLTAALALAGAAFLFGVALGERGELGVVQYVFLGGVPVAALVLASFARRARIEVILGGAAMFAGVVIGQQAFRDAFAECIEKGPVVHAAIQRYTREHGEFPHDLEKLGIDLPCECLLRKSILHYAHNERSYRVWFTNDFATHSATDKQGF